MANRRAAPHQRPCKGQRSSSAGLFLVILAFGVLSACDNGGSAIPDGPVTWGVDPAGRGSFTSIQQCIIKARDGDTCRVMPGEYREALRFFGRAITVISREGPEETILGWPDDSEVEDRERVVRFIDNESEDTVLEGFTIRNGRAASSPEEGADAEIEHGGGILIISASPTIRNCVLRNNEAQGHGGGIYCFASASQPTITHVVFDGNTAAGQGGALFVVQGAPHLENCLLIDNQATQGGAIAATSGASVSVTGSTLAGNQATERGDALYLLNATSLWTNTIGWGNGTGTVPVLLRLETTPGQVPEEDAVQLILSHTALQTTPGAIPLEGDCADWPDSCEALAQVVQGESTLITEDPLFVDGPGGAYYLSQVDAGQASDSPCVDAGDKQVLEADIASWTTRTDEMEDLGTVDLGYHYPVSPEESL